MLGLGDAVRITTDRWGVPHVVAHSAADAFAGQGYAQARLRLFQIDLWRRRGRGTLAEVMGPDAVRLDVAARAFRSRHPLDDEFAAFPQESRERIEAFVRGLNAHIAEVLKGTVAPPPEFTALGWEPAPISVEDVLRTRLHGMATNAEEELARALTLRDHGAAIERLRRPLEPAHDLGPLLIDPALLDDDVLSFYRAAREPTPFAAPDPQPGRDGSNNWAIAGSRTRTGRPIVANDPHRIMTFPSLRVLVHLSCPEFDAIGMNEPYLPGITAGHNDRVAWGITIAPADLEDLYVYELDASGEHYRHEGAWRPFEVVTERIGVAGHADQAHEVRYSVHGPVLRIDRDRRTAVGIRAAWLDPGMTPYLAAICLLESRDVADHRARLASWGNPVLNFVAADVDGAIGWQVAGRVPERGSWDGLLPVPGDGTREWRRMRGTAELPGVADPAQGWVRSANQYNLDEDPDWSGEPTGYEWYPAYRARRIGEVLSSSDDWTVSDVAALQGDAVAITLDDVRFALADPQPDPDAEFARREILAWDGRMTTGSRAAAIFDRWLYTELPAVLRPVAAARLVAESDAEAATALLLDRSRMTMSDSRVDIELLAEAEPEVVGASLAAAVSWLRARLGDDPGAWSWGALHVAHLIHPLRGMPGIDPAVADTGPHPKAGSSDTIGVAFGAAGVQTLGAATRIVMDVGAWDESLFINAPGQDGALDAPHVVDLFSTWLADGHVPLLYSPARIAEAAESAVELRPDPAP